MEEHQQEIIKDFKETTIIPLETRQSIVWKMVPLKPMGLLKLVFRDFKDMVLKNQLQFIEDGAVVVDAIAKSSSKDEKIKLDKDWKG